MKKKTIYELVSLYKLDDQAKNKFDGIIDTYVERIKNSKKEPLSNALKEMLVTAIKKMVKGDGEPITLLIDSFKDDFIIDDLIDASVLKQDAIINQESFQNGVEYLLCEGVTVSSALLGVFFSSMIKKEALTNTLKNTLRTYLNHRIFALHVVNYFDDEPDFLKLYHNVYYDTYGKNKMDKVDFYFDFTLDQHQSIFHRLHKKKEDFIKMEVFKPMAKYEEKDNEEFIALLFKHNNELFTFEEVENMLFDFDKFFERNYDTRLMVSAFLGNYREHFNDYEYIVQLIMTLLTRSRTPQGFKFAISMTRIFQYAKDNDKLYKLIEDISFIDELVQYSLFALQSHDKFQKVLLKLAKKATGIPLAQMILYLDLSSEKNQKFVYDALKKPFVRQACAVTMMNKFNLSNFILEADMLEGDVNFVINLLLGASTNAQFGELCDVPQFDDMIIEFYSRYYNVYHDKFHYLNAALLTYVDEHKTMDSAIKTKIKNALMDFINYEEETSYIEVSLENKKMDVDELACMMEYYEYYPESLVLKAFHSNPVNCIRFLNVILNMTKDDDNLDECLKHLDRVFIVNPNALDIKNGEFYKDSKPSGIEEGLKMMMIADCLKEVSEYYPNLYHIGINYYEVFIRLLFYKALEKLNEEIIIDDMTLFEEIENNLLYETYDKILKKMNKILGLDNIVVS